MPRFFNQSPSRATEHSSLPLVAGTLAAFAILSGVFWRSFGVPSPGMPRLAQGTFKSITRAGDAAHQCIECHRWEASFSHPTDVVPSMKVPSNFPLERGQVTCLTCHTQVDHTGRGLGPMLRSESTGSSLCTQCHIGKSRDRASMHGMGLEQAHLALPRSHRGAAAPVTRGSEELDRESETCMSCHDGTSASDAGSHSLPGAFRMGDSRADHPVGVRYDTRAALKRDVRLVEIERLDHRVRLFDQSIGCGSCHSPYAATPSLLVVNNRGSGLCFECHVE